MPTNERLFHLADTAPGYRSAHPGYRKRAYSRKCQHHSRSAPSCGLVCAAACVYALDHHVARLADDHANARALARGLSQIDGMQVQQPETNLVFFDPAGNGMSGEKLVAALGQHGILLATMDGRIRACTHLDVTAAMIEETVTTVREIVRGA